MMHAFKRGSLVSSILGAVMVASSWPLSPNFAAVVDFGQKEVDQSKFIAIAKPVGKDSHQLLVLEQVTDKKQCWSEKGSNPTLIDPLLLTFDFTGICGRSTDANGYSIRMDGKDFGGKYTLRIRYRNNEMVLVGSPDNPRDSEIAVGRVSRVVQDFAKIQLDPDWYFAKRTFGPKTLGHIYLVKDSSLGNTPPVLPTTSGFTDIAGNTYVKEIQEGVALKFATGYQDNTYKPQTPINREQLVSMIVDALKTVPGASLPIPTTVTTNPYPDVEATRWSAAKIAFARDKKIVSAYPDGTFQPLKRLTRAEVLSILSRAAEYAKTQKKQPIALTPTQAVFKFSDTDKHWAAKLISQMSGYCGVASPINEKGTAFAPNDTALRDYAAAATLRTVKCLQKKP